MRVHNISAVGVQPLQNGGPGLSYGYSGRGGADGRDKRYVYNDGTRGESPVLRGDYKGTYDGPRSDYVREFYVPPSDRAEYIDIGLVGGHPNVVEASKGSE